MTPHFKDYRKILSKNYQPFKTYTNAIIIDRRQKDTILTHS